ncbi:hypothetical protein [Natrinema sp. DC36]|uniref:hypothetical protein n=1 Tax=Natrinema sp. DC36 TaxID=2878680 RepID=UPI001CF04E1D|nr:hypothetical protein [Natrinema sp. DC36]
MDSDLETDRRFDAFCVFHAAIGWVRLFAGLHIARQPLVAPVRFERYVPRGQLVYELLVLLALVVGLAVFLGALGVWLIYGEADSERKQRIMNWSKADE